MKNRYKFPILEYYDSDDDDILNYYCDNNIHFIFKFTFCIGVFDITRNKGDKYYGIRVHIYENHED
jgi:hypothetical protein